MTARCLLFPTIPTLDDWCEEFGVSRPSIVKDVRAVREWLADRRLALVGKAGVGYSLLAREFDLRNAVVDYLLEGDRADLPDREERTGWPEGHEVFGEFDFSPVRTFLATLQQELRAEFVEHDCLALACYIALVVVRIRAGRSVPHDLGDLSSLLETVEYRLVATLATGLSTAYTVAFSPAETAHLTLNVICAKEVRVRPAAGETRGGDEAGRLADEVAADVEEVFGIPLSRDRDFLGLLATHIGLTLRKLRYGVSMAAEGPTEEIKQQHPLAFGVGLRFLERLSQRLGRKVPLVEATYVAMHVAAGLEKVKYRLQRRKRVALVCTTALSASTLLFWQLTNLLPQVDVVEIGSWEDVVGGGLSSQVDLIVSTVPLPPLDVPAVVVSPLFTPGDRRRIVAAIEAKPDWDLVRRTAGQLLDPATILLGQAYDTSDTLLTAIGRRMTAQGYVRRGFTGALLERERRFGSALDTPVPLAMPHAGPGYTRRATVGLVTLAHPVPFRLVSDPERNLLVRLLIVPVLTLDDLTGMRFCELFAALRRKKVSRAVLDCEEPDQVTAVLEAALRTRLG